MGSTHVRPGFFRRALLKKEPFKCVKNSSCVITTGKKAPCSYCRYQRCLAVGMSKEGVQRGRYSLEKKTQVIMRSKSIEKAEKEGKPMTFHKNGDDVLDSRRLSSVGFTHVGQVKQEPVEEHKSMGSGDQIFNRKDTGQGSSSDSGACKEHNNAADVLDLKSLLIKDSGLSSEEKDLEIELFVRHHMSNYLYSEEFYQRVPKLKQEYLARNDPHPKPPHTNGALPLLDPKEHTALFESIGVDIDGRRDLITAHAGEFADCIVKLVQVAKKVPKFRELHQEDQIALIKGFIGPWNLIAKMEAYDCEHMLVFLPETHILNFDQIATMLGCEEHVWATFAVSKKMQDLNLDPVERALLSGLGLLLADTGNTKLRDRNMVESAQVHMVDLLQHYCKKKHKDKGRFIKLFMGWIDMKEYEFVFRKMEDGFLAMKLELPQIVTETFTE